MSTNQKWANRAKTQAAAIPLTKPVAAPVRDGKRFEGVLEAFTFKTFKTGSFGAEIKYAVEGLERAVYENLVLYTLSDAGALTPTKYGEASFKRRLQAYGYTADEVNSFTIPKMPKEVKEDAINFIGAPVALILTDEEYMGKPKKRVKAVFQLDR